MLRLFAIICLVGTLACTSAPREVRLPATVDGGWRLKTSAPLDAAEAPGKIPMLKPVRMLRGAYDGPTAIEVEVYQFRNNTTAFEALQSWRPDGKRIVRHRNDLFVTAHSPQPDRSALDTFLNGLEKAL